MESFAQIASKLNFDGNTTGKMGKSTEEQLQVIDPKDSVWNEIRKMGNPQKFTTGESGDGSGGGAASAPGTGKVKKGAGSKPGHQGKVTNKLIYAAGRTLSVPTKDMEGTTNGGVGSARKVGKDLCNVICESLMERGMQPDELLHDLKKRLQETKANKKQTRKSAILQRKVREADLASALEETTLDSVSSSDNQ